MTPTSPPSDSEQCQETDAKPCCKCAAYREIIQENAAKIAALTEWMVDHRRQSGWDIGNIDKLIGKRP
jgi:hypothetical protein